MMKLKKKILALFLCVLFAVSTVGCDKTEGSSESAGSDVSSAVSETESATEASSTVSETSSSVSDASSTVSEVEVVDKDAPEYLKKNSDGLLALESKIRNANIIASTAIRVSGYKLSIRLPDNVKIKFVKENTDGTRYQILFDDILAGECYINSRDLPNNTEQISSESNTITATVDVKKLTLLYKGENASWEVPVYQLFVRNQQAQQYAMFYFRQDMFSYNKIIEMARWLDFGYLPETSRAGEKDYSGKNCTILILGNSFIYSSQVFRILQDMARDNNVNLTVDAESRGYATVQTYASDPLILQKLRNGVYDVVFLCGFYSDMNSQLEILLNEKSNSTKIVIFPAHNEAPDVPYKTKTLYPETGIADWKGFINKLIDMGIDYSRMCIDDMHKHSTNLAGYAGASMIYSYLYKKAPGDGAAGEMVIGEQISYDVAQRQVESDLEIIRKAAYDYLYN